MDENLELPKSVFDALSQAAEASGMTPVAWIAAHLPNGSQMPDNAEQVATMAERFAGQIGRIQSGGKLLLSENTGDKFTDGLVAKMQAGHL